MGLHIGQTYGQELADRFWASSDGGGTNGTIIPWVDGGTSRYQQVYDAVIFGKLPKEGAFLSEIYLASACDSKGSWDVTNLQVNASTTPRKPDGLSHIFSENVGVDDFVVLSNQRPRGITTDGDCGSGAAFMAGVDSSFFYNPTNGNLLLDFRNIGSRYPRNPFFPDSPTFESGKLNAAIDQGDWSSRAYASSVTATEAELVDTVALFTEFIFVPIPKLRIWNNTNEIVLRWETHPREFRLQKTGSLKQGTVWQPYTGAIDENASWRTVSIPVASLKKPTFFRVVWNTPQKGVPSIQAVIELQN